MTPLERYKQDLEQPGFVHDPDQERLMRYAEQLYHELAKPDETSWWQRWFREKTLPRGMYIWGGVGRGKTWILNRLNETLPGPKRRLHFHEFMQEIHRDLHEFRRQADPLQLVADKLAAEFRILLLDEFHVHDIADAMLLGGLLELMFDRGIILVTTSNTPPDDLYRDGLQRDQFLPAIEQISLHTEVLELPEGEDYRQRNARDEAWHREQEERFLRLMKREGMHQDDYDRKLVINNRILQTRAANDNVVWFDFNEICNTHRSAADYVRIASLFAKVYISDIPILDENLENAALRFVHLIDALYDRNVQLVYYADAAPDQLYEGRLVRFQFRRTASRLTEMAVRSHAAAGTKQAST